MKSIEAIEETQLQDRPDMQPGDTVRVQEAVSYLQTSFKLRQKEKSSPRNSMACSQGGTPRCMVAAARTSAR